MRVQIEVDDELATRLKEEAERQKRGVLHEGANLLREALDARDRKAGRK